MSASRVSFLTVLSLLAFAGNSVLCRIALKETAIDGASFTTIRLVSGALVLYVIAASAGRGKPGGGSWASAIALFVYAAAFSFAYVTLSTATGALILFGAVQATMITYGWMTGDRLESKQLVGLALALLGLVALLLPGLSAPPVLGSILMCSAGIAWGVYSLRGRGAGDPARVTSGNFIRAALLACILSAVLRDNVQLDLPGISYAIASGAIASGLGYAIWYSVLPLLKATSAASVQLSVPLIAAFGGMLVLGEPITVRFIVASVAILGGIAMVVLSKPQSRSS